MPSVRDRTLLVRRIVLWGAPAALGALELWHPHYAGDAAQELLPHAQRWLVVHVVQLPLLGLLALALLLLVSRLSGTAAWISRAGSAVFVVFYVALDATAGIATGVLAHHATSLPPEPQATVAHAIDTLFTHPVAGGGLSLITVVATGGWLAAVLGAAAALARAGAGTPPVLLLSVAAVLFTLGHVAPFGPLAMAALLGAAVWVELRPLAAER